MRKHVLFAPIVALAISGCVSVLPEPETPEALYRFGIGQSQSSFTLASNVIISEPEAVGLTGGKSIVIADEVNQIAVLKSYAWSDRATRLFQLGLLDAFDNSENGLAVSSQSGVRAPYELRWRISDFAVRDGIATCELVVTLVDTQRRNPVAQRRVRETYRVQAETNNGQVEALTRVADTAIDRVASFLSSELAPDWTAIDG